MIPDRPRVVLTGAGGGLGRAFAERLAARGASLLLSDIDSAGLEETARLVKAGGGTPHTMTCDVAKASDVEAMHGRATQLLGGVDLLINNAGVAVGGAVGTVPLQDWDWIMGINLWGVIYGCHYFLPEMRARGAGHVLNVASIAAFACAGEMGPYNVTKAGVVAMTETLAGELVGTNVGATVLCPFFFKTNIAKSARSASPNVSPSQIEKIMGRTKVQAAEVAERALKACNRGELYCFPHTEAKVIAALKRSAPETLLKQLAPRLAKSVPR
jgi:NAD(P)-dependent dehydrogenase (short-subunit alcohol dehydrogenase family)